MKGISVSYTKLVDLKNESLVDPATIQEIKEAKELATIIRIVHKRKVSLESLIYEMRIQHKEAGKDSKVVLYTQEGVYLW